MLVVTVGLFAAAFAAPLIFRRLGRSTFYVLAAVPAAGLAWLLLQLPAVLAADQAAPAGAAAAPPGLTVPWIPALDVELAFRLDALSAVLGILVLGVGALVLFYCARYFKNDDPNIGPFGAQLTAFAASMFGLVTADDLILLFIFWELTTVLSYLLIGYARTRIYARRSALQALIVTTFGGLTMLLGLVLLGQVAGTYRLSEILASAAAGTPELIGTTVDIAILLILVGAVSKSALVPFHFWLPGAMAAPTPVSAYLHAAAMVKAGVYLIARLAPGFSTTAFWHPTLITLGLVTLFVGGWRALRQHDIKLILAYGTVSQLGFLIVVASIGTPDAALAAIALLMAHALFKAALFLGVGIIDHQAGTRDVRKLSGLARSAPKLFAVCFLGAASMAGLPPLYGFVAKEAVFESLLGGGTGLEGTFLGIGTAVWVVVAIVAGSVLTFAYSARFVWGAFATKPGVAATEFRPVPWMFIAAPAVLTLGTIVLAWIPGVVETLAAPYAALFGVSAEPIHLALWHGLTPALGLSAVVVLVGTAMFAARGAVARAQDKVYPLIDLQKLYRYTIGGLDNLAVWVTGRTQSGSLQHYLMVILIVGAATPAAAAIFMEQPVPLSALAFESPAQLVIGLCMIAGALLAVRANKRFLAVLMVAVTGYGMATIFALHGAPDLALTQLLVETIVLVAMVLALRSLPARLWVSNQTDKKWLRAAIGIGFAAVMVAIAVAAQAGRIADPISLSLPKMAYEIGNGHNIVNVILVDIRAWDTFGEITVLVAAATGVASLIYVRGRGDGGRALADVEPGSVDRGSEHIHSPSRKTAALAIARYFAESAREAWIVAGRTLAPERRSIIFEVVTRLLFHSLLLISVYLLLAGHNLPGGGFAGGLLAGLAFVIRYLAGGRYELAEATPISPGTLLGLGLGIAATSVVAPVAFGGELFQSAAFEFTLPIFGDHKFVTSTVFDVGVYLVVLGLALDVIRSLGSEIDERSEGRGITERHDDVPGTNQGVSR
ncbi:Na+/H+ antiporter subunit A [Zhihengliuella halotolerans]|uniref:Multisubunit sodium/proton antiporter MrpA subunit /multisubunit sodium/proton antiporter MrpB subunit n=1 Tax=Zhihengliuella halotolerans TaxID=370736 RepID=A0A4Q8AE00_9MICC|nr:Na+/H+ antiporter subunit A [Zhihengliuella halotolerans]RZU62438.1 multisubunit sodium/proton antiporter MrpA subunit /multisubunit sodium/proton antiporter MrpB subunit [Zhihengliuella halotolerans]